MSRVQESQHRTALSNQALALCSMQQQLSETFIPAADL